MASQARHSAEALVVQQGDVESASLPPTSGQAKLTVADAIEDLGLGPAQFSTLALSSAGVNFCDGLELTLVNLITVSTSRDFGLGPNERAAVSTVTLAGVMSGSLFSGYCGDSLGRRAPTVWCLACTALLGFASPSMPSFALLLLVRTLLGFSMGLGLPPSVALVSEVTPEAWRIPMRTLSASCFACGGIFVTLLAALDDPSCQALHWRRLMLIAAIPPAIWWAVSARYLPESPTFLASSGRHEEAAEGFQYLQNLNQRPEVQIDFSSSVMWRGSRKVLPPLDVSLRVVFSKRYRGTTFALLFAAFCTNLVCYGDAYAGPQVLTESSEMAPAFMLLIKNSLALLSVGVAGIVAQVLPRKGAIALSQAVMGFVCLCFALAGSSLGDRPTLQHILFQCGAHGSVVGSSLAYIVIYQLSVELYPTIASSTGGAVIIGGGRIAAVLAPLAFENIRGLFGLWTAFYYFMSGMCLISVAAVAWMPSPRPFRAGTSPFSPKGEPSPRYGSTNRNRK